MRLTSERSSNEYELTNEELKHRKMNAALSKMNESAPIANSADAPEVEVTFDEFKRIDIRVSRVLEVSRVPNSAKLLRLILDVGGQRKQCIAGIGSKYAPEQVRD